MEFGTSVVFILVFPNAYVHQCSKICVTSETCSVSGTNRSITVINRSDHYWNLNT